MLHQNPRIKRPSQEKNRSTLLHPLNPNLRRRLRLTDHTPQPRRLGYILDIDHALDDLLLDQLRDAEEIVHLLQAHALGLGDEEPDEEEHAETEAAEDQVCAVAVGANGREHVGDGSVDGVLAR